MPGTILAQRYRIVELLGKGGMGEVYRVDDLRLGQSIALKFLTAARATDAGALAALNSEVRNARVVAHPNVCRVYDVGEIDGLAFISMEYVDGEHLHSLLRRIGRLPQDKALQIAQQLCLGLAAIHDQGLLHRDLKPTNVMVDGRGRARITDFGLAGMAQELASAGQRAGTPAYMAPEQITGQSLSTRSDIYALGLVLYELFTGKRVFEGRSWSDFVHLHQQHIPQSPAQLVEDLDPAIERVILDCLSKDPQHRPVSALAVAAALPGGDPLAAALAAGETPSPEVVAASRVVEGLSPMVALACLIGVLVGLVGVAFLTDQASLRRMVPFEHPPAVLVERAQALVRLLGYTDRPGDTAAEYFTDTDVMKYIRDERHGPKRWEELSHGRTPAVGFWYRASPRRMIPQNLSGRVTPDDPPAAVSGMVNVSLDSRGRLLRFQAVPPQTEQVATTLATESWTALFDAAGLDASCFRATEPRWTPPTYADARAAWEPVDDDAAYPVARVEAGAYRGQPVYFAVIAPWTRAERMQPPYRDPRLGIYSMLLVSLLGAVLLGGVLLTWRNLHVNRGDRKGAFRVATYLFVTGLVAWLVTAHHPDNAMQIIASLITSLGPVAFFAGLFWLMYMALEPAVRRRWPRCLVSWTRLVSGRLRDPLVGRDVLIGILAGVVSTALGCLVYLVPRWLGESPPRPVGLGGLPAFAGSELVGLVLNLQSIAVFNGLLIMFLPLLFFIVVRREWLAAALALLFWTFLLASSRDFTLLGLASSAVAATLWTAVALRVGLLAGIVQFFVLFLLEVVPWTLDWSAWYAGLGYGAVIPIAGLAVVAFYVSLGGRPLLRGDLLEA